MSQPTLLEYAGEWWNELVSVDGIPAATTREDEITEQGYKMLEEIELFLTARAEEPDVQAFMGLGLIAKKPPCVRVLWRGVVVCSHTVPKLNAWAKSVGDDILLWPLAGCGSYQTSTKASAGTHAGGGAIDIDLRAVPSTKRKWVADQGRLHGLQISWHRNAITGVWTWHAHALDPDCPQLASVAASQCVECFNGGDGLVGTRPDGNIRTNITQLRSIFNARAVMEIVDEVVEIGKEVADRARVIELQAVVKQPKTGYWDIETDMPLAEIRTTAKDNYTGAQFKTWSLAKRKAAQRLWGVTQDGLWGPQTAAAARVMARRVQGALSVTVDGIWGTSGQTEKAYVALRTRTYRRFRFSRPTGAFPTPGGKGSLYGPSTVGRPWYSGAASGVPPKGTIQWQIRRIQRMVGVAPDGLYRAGTVAGVRRWQSRHKLQADGIVGPMTWAAMVKANVV